MRQQVQNRMAEVGKSVNMTSELGVSFHSEKKRECKRMGNRIQLYMESDHSHTAYRIRMPQPQAAYAYRVYGILALAGQIDQKRRQSTSRNGDNTFTA